MSDTEQMSLADFVKQRGVTLAAEWTDRNPHMDDSDNMDNWKCRLRCGKCSMTLYFSKGTGHGGAKPTVEEVLDCLASDSAGIENANSFEDWASEYGYDTDSRTAHKTYRTCERQAEKLTALLGEESYKQLLWETERL